MGSEEGRTTVLVSIRRYLDDAFEIETSDDRNYVLAYDFRECVESLQIVLKDYSNDVIFEVEWEEVDSSPDWQTQDPEAPPV